MLPKEVRAGSEGERGQRGEARVLQQPAEGEFQVVHRSLKALKGLNRYIVRGGERVLASRFHVLTIQRFQRFNDATGVIHIAAPPLDRAPPSPQNRPLSLDFGLLSSFGIRHSSFRPEVMGNRAHADSEGSDAFKPLVV